MMTRDQIVEAGIRAAEVVNGFKMPTQQNARDAARLAETAMEAIRTIDRLKMELKEARELPNNPAGMIDWITRNCA